VDTAKFWLPEWPVQKPVWKTATLILVRPNNAMRNAWEQVRFNNIQLFQGGILSGGIPDKDPKSAASVP